jgi:hypothetical protein
MSLVSPTQLRSQCFRSGQWEQPLTRPAASSLIAVVVSVSGHSVIHSSLRGRRRFAKPNTPPRPAPTARMVIDAIPIAVSCLS